MVMTITAPAHRPNTAARWGKAAERAVAEGVRVMQLPSCGVWVATSSSDAATAYVVTTDDCECHAGAHGDPVCKHRAALRLHLGLVTLPEPVAAPVAARMCSDCLETGMARMHVGYGLNDWVAIPCTCPAAAPLDCVRPVVAADHRASLHEESTMTSETTDPAASPMYCDVLSANGTLIVEGVTLGSADRYASDYRARTGLAARIVLTTLTAAQIAAGYADMTIAERVAWHATGHEPWDDDADDLPSDDQIDALLAQPVLPYDPVAIDTMLDARMSANPGPHVDLPGDAPVTEAERSAAFAQSLEPTWADLERRWAQQDAMDVDDSGHSDDEPDDGQWMEARSPSPSPFRSACRCCDQLCDDKRIGLCDHCWLYADIETEQGADAP